MKQCNVCNQFKSIDQFHSNGRTPKGTKKIKPMCANCELVGKRTSAKTILAELVKMSCVRCGYDRCVSAIDFHHVDSSTKDFNIGAQRIADVEKIKTEMKKCVILCSNCHKEHHAGLFEVNNLPRAGLCK